MADEVKLYSVGGSPYVCRVKIALNLKGIKYENVEQDLSNKSDDLIKYNPVYKKVPVLVHNGNPISESLVIIEYVEDVWKGVPILPQDPYQKAVARFWAKFIDDKCIPAVSNAFRSKGEEQAVAEAHEQLKVLENELAVKGTKFFGGDSINLVDIAADFIAFWVGILEEASGIKLVTKDKFPKLTEWSDDFVNCQVVKEVLPPREHPLAFFKKRFETRKVHLMQGSTSNPISPMQGSTSVGVGDDNQQSQDAHEYINLDGDETRPNDQNTNEDASVREENTENAKCEEELELKRKRQRTSSVWEEFVDVTLPDGKIKVECIHCSARLAKIGSGTTTTYRRHLNTCSKRKAYQKTQQMLNFQPVDVDMGYNKLPPLIGTDTKYDPIKMREAIANWIMGTEQPFIVVEDDLFVYMMKRANPLFKKISRATAKEDCKKVYEHERKKLKNLTDAASKISLTTDCWKSSHQRIEYMVITGHFIDQNWRLQKRVLSFVHVPPPRTGLDIADGIYKCLKEWEIEGKIFSISVDNASYNDRAVNTLKNNTNRVKKLPCGGRLFHVRCCAHILNLLVKDGLSKIDFVIQEVREAVKFINSSEARRQTFSNAAHQLQVRDRKLSLDVPTRWNSTYDMLCIALKFKDVFPRYAEYETHFHHVPNEDDWINVESVCEILKVFKVCTNVISGSEYPTSNLYLIEVYKVKETLDRAAQSSDDFIREMALKMKEKFDKYWGECHLLMAIASVLDPRFKMKLVEFSYPKLYPPNEATNNIKEVKKAIEDMYDDYLEVHNSLVKEASTYASGTSGGSNASVSNEGTPLESGWEAFGQFIKSVDLEGPEKSELDLYLEENVHWVEGQGGKHSFNALEWWNMHKLKYRVLSKMAMDVLAIPISTVASESTFSAGGRVIDPYRSLLAPDTVQMLICGGDWIRHMYGIKKNLKKEEIPTEVVLPAVKTS